MQLYNGAHFQIHGLRQRYAILFYRQLASILIRLYAQEKSACGGTCIGPQGKGACRGSILHGARAPGAVISCQKR